MAYHNFNRSCRVAGELLIDEISSSEPPECCEDSELRVFLGCLDSGGESRPSVFEGRERTVIG